MTDKLMLGERAKSAMNDFVRPAFDVVRAQYAIKLADVASSEPWETGKITALAHAIKVLDAVQSQVDSIAAEGAFEREDRRFAEQMTNVRPTKRSLLDWRR